MGRKNKIYKRKKSLVSSVTRLLVVIAVILFLASIVINFLMLEGGALVLFSYSGALTTNSISKVMRSSDGLAEYAADLMDVYESLPEAIREKQDSPEYAAYFKEFSESDYYQKSRNLMREMVEDKIMSDASLIVLDPERWRIVYLVDVNDSGENLSRVGHTRPMTKDEYDEISSGRKADLHAIVPDEEEASNIDDFIYVTVTEPVLTTDRGVTVYAMANMSLGLGTEVTRRYMIWYLLTLAGAITLIVIAARLLMRKRLVKPIRQISRAAGKFIRDRRAGISEGLHFDHLNIQTKDELQDLGNLVAEMERDITGYEQRLVAETTAQEHMQTELRLAAGIQESMVARTFPAFPDRKDFDIYATMTPAQEIGGDFYDFFLIDSAHLGLVIADVSGRGVPAALYMMSSKIILYNYASLGYSPKEVLQMANEKICQKNHEDMFVTVWFGVLDLETGVIRAANAGHNYPVISRRGRWELLKDHHDLVLGGMPGIEYHEYTVTLKKGDSIFVYTDGLNEAECADGRMFGTRRIVNALNASDWRSLKEMLDGVQAEAATFVAGAPQFDDITMMCVTWNGAEEASA